MAILPSFFLFIVVIQGTCSATMGFRSYKILPSISDVRKLKVGVELFGEQLDLEMGRCIYVLEGLELPKSYEVKISYPASIPASFTIDLLKGGRQQAIRGGRKLLNTEKLLFRADESQVAEVSSGVLSAHVLITVEPAGFLARPHKKDHGFVVFNILCEEVRFGIPRQAWFIILLGTAAILIAAFVPMLLPPHVFPRQFKEQAKKPSSKS